MSSKVIGGIVACSILITVTIIALSSICFAAIINEALGTPASVSIKRDPSSKNNTSVFEPSLRDVYAGTTVIWTNNDLTFHTVISGALEHEDSGIEFSSGNMPAGETFQHTFNSVGTFEYYCIIHPYMRGDVMVNFNMEYSLR